jgi:hypothetical protein
LIAVSASRAAAPAAGLGNYVSPNPTPSVDPALGVLINPARAPEMPDIGGFLANANKATILISPISVIDKMASIITSSLFGDNIGNQSRQQLLDSRQSFENNVREHRQKLEDYKRDPDAHDNKGMLQNVTTDNRTSIIDGRIRSLEKQIEKNQKNLDKVNQRLESIDNEAK